MNNQSSEKESAGTFVVTVRLTGQAAQRCAKLQRIEAHGADERTIELRCRHENTTKQWFYRWRQRIDEAIQEALSDRQRSGRPNKEDAAMKVRMTIERQQRKIRTAQGQLNALSAELDDLKKATSELLERTDKFIESEVAAIYRGEICACDAPR